MSESARLIEPAIPANILAQDNHDASNESDPLISRDYDGANDISSHSQSGEPEEPVVYHNGVPILWYLTGLIILLELEEVVQSAPTIRLLELAICQRYYGDRGIDGPIDEGMCKIDDVQTQLAYIKGGQGFFEAIPTLLLAIPYGYYADKRGRRFVLFLTELGLILAMAWILLVCYNWETIPIQAVWGTGVFRIIGAGPAVAFAMIMSMVADVSSETSRSRNFYKLFSAYLCTQLVGPPLTYWAMKKALWLPYIICMISLAASFPILLAIPETLSYVKRRTEYTDDDSDSNGIHANGHGGKWNWRTKLPDMSVYKKFMKDYRIILGLVATFIAQIRMIALEIIMPYASKKFGWELSETTSLIFLVAVVNLVLFLVILPYITEILKEKTEMPSKKIDLWIARISHVCFTVGSLILFFSWVPVVLFIGLAVFSLGFGARVSMLSALTGLVHKEETARLYTLVSILEAGSHLTSSPSLQAALAQGIKWGGKLLGFPFLVMALYFPIGVACSFLIRIDGDIGGNEDEQSLAEESSVLQPHED
ncbi:hypothetical protein ABW19_dt0204557 [Dactylella cylindrospora]|nr:hypothetical protein ABW19_dt0204557 [Dactylella cylindrospora]